MGACVEGGRDGRTNEWQWCWVDGWLFKWLWRWVDRWMHGQMTRQMGGRIDTDNRVKVRVPESYSSSPLISSIA